jgi:hypothetical protein
MQTFLGKITSHLHYIHKAENGERLASIYQNLMELIHAQGSVIYQCTHYEGMLIRRTLEILQCKMRSLSALHGEIQKLQSLCTLIRDKDIKYTDAWHAFNNLPDELNMRIASGILYEKNDFGILDLKIPEIEVIFEMLFAHRKTLLQKIISVWISKQRIPLASLCYNPLLDPKVSCLMPWVRNLNFAHCQESDYQGLRALQPGVFAKELQLSSGIGDATLASIVKLPAYAKLSKLTLQSTFICQKGFNIISLLTDLKVLELKDNRSDSVIKATAISALTKLQQIVLADCHLSSAIFDALIPLTGLQKLFLSSTNPDFIFNDLEYSSLRALTNLTEVNIANCGRLPDVPLKMITLWTNLKHLTLNACPDMEDRSQQLSNLTNLHALVMGGFYPNNYLTALTKLNFITWRKKSTRHPVSHRTNES